MKTATRIAAVFAAGAVAGAIMHERWVGPSFALGAIGQAVLARRESAAATASQLQHRR